MATPSQPWRRVMSARSTDQHERAATPLELFFDLCFVVAVAQAAASLHHAVAENHMDHALTGYLSVFFAIWWAWMNFTWFASAYDNDDVLYRLGVFVQIAGVLVLAAGVPDAFDGDFTVITIGYVIMRLALVSMWIRAGLNDPDRRRTDFRYAAGVSVLQVGWVLNLFVPEAMRPFGFVLLVAAVLAVPVWAERTGATTWHAQHLAERYGLFTIIVLGESILGTTIAAQSAFASGSALPSLILVAISGLVVVCAMWWLYFSQPAAHILVVAREAATDAPSREPFIWGYGHYFVFASAAAVGAGLAVVVDQVTHQAHISARVAVIAVAIPLSIYIVTVWFLHRQMLTGALRFTCPAAAVLVLAAGILGLPLAAVAVVLVALIAWIVVDENRASHAT